MPDPKKSAAPADSIVAVDDTDADIPDLSYEDARDELVAIVSKLEGSSADLEESMHLWGRGEKLAAHCQRKLDSVEEQLDAAATDAGDAAPDGDG
ncbi:exodeoxyribonuclease VII small subunit [Demetria terragena]|uniref:exodeoxyribonuclease VII small subunit n=1 Tax=Demetria terragena TaxID=63959 RepID=UPI00036C1DDD|nr:exodeoxyribonuclease VII small subunit [Demetria terragena]